MTPEEKLNESVSRNNAMLKIIHAQVSALADRIAEREREQNRARRLQRARMRRIPAAKVKRSLTALSRSSRRIERTLQNRARR